MKMFFVLLVSLICTTTSFSKPTLSLFGAVDVGKVVKGTDDKALLNPDQLESQKYFSPENSILQRSFVNIGVHNDFDENSSIDVGIGGVFWKGRDQVDATYGSKNMQFGPGISHLFLTNSFGDNIQLRYGYFPYKYNDAARNLGEYLFRSEAYPVVIYTGGWSWMNSANYSAVGAQLSITSLNGTLTQDVLLFMEYFNSPIFDITPAYVVKWKPNDVFTLGGGLSWHRALSPTKGTDRETKQTLEYYENKTIPALLNEGVARSTNTTLIGDLDITWDELDSSSIRQELYNSVDPVLLTISGINSPSEIEFEVEVTQEAKEARTVSTLKGDVIEDLRDAISQGNTVDTTDVKTVSFDLTTFRPMVFFDVNLNNAFDFSKENGLFNVYGEAALLGYQDYDVFYTNKLERLPVMFGISIPTFILDHLSLEVEYLQNPHAESIDGVFRTLELAPDAEYRTRGFFDIKEDDLKWSLHASKSLNSTFSVYLQVANDHLRLKNDDTTPMHVPVTNKSSHWYWLARLQWAM